jgi:hypothetical protein
VWLDKRRVRKASEDCTEDDSGLSRAIVRAREDAHTREETVAGRRRTRDVTCGGVKSEKEACVQRLPGAKTIDQGLLPAAHTDAALSGS